MNTQPLISVIVPIYKVEKYLNQCIGSIVSQTYHKLEIILVDDGSPDNCPKICDEWAEKDNRIIVFHIKNGGAGYARNIGIESAHGDWIVLVDGDDYIDYRMIDHLYQLTNSTVDLTECVMIATESDDASFSMVNSKESLVRCDAQTALSYHIDNKFFQATPPNKLYRSTIIKKILFPVGKTIDDEFWTYKVIGECRDLIHSDSVLYAYRQHSGSVMHKEYSINRLHALDAMYNRWQYMKEYYPENESKAKICLLKACFFHGQLILKNLFGDEKKEAQEKVKYYYNMIQIEKNEYSLLGKERVWIKVAKLSFNLTCLVKNLFRVGI